jgi:hypothetical protein
MTLQDLRNDPSLWDKLRGFYKASEEKSNEASSVIVEGSDEYYQKLGELVEEYPIVSGGIRRG